MGRKEAEIVLCPWLINHIEYLVVIVVSHHGDLGFLDHLSVDLRVFWLKEVWDGAFLCAVQVCKAIAAGGVCD